MRMLVYFGIGLIAISCEKNITSEKDKLSYALGTQFAGSLKEQKVEIDGKAVARAVNDVMNGKQPAISSEEIMASLQKMNMDRAAAAQNTASENLRKSLTFLETNARTEGIQITKSGLQYKVIEQGKGPSPKKNDAVAIHFSGVEKITDTEFDSSYKRNQPDLVAVSKALPGWQEILPLLRKGDKFQVFMPPQLAFGERGTKTVPPNAALAFNGEIVDVMPQTKQKKSAE